MKLLTLEIFLQLKKVSEPQLSPNGKWCCYVVAHADLDEDKNFSSLWLVDCGTGKTTALTHGNWADSHPRWSPDGLRLLFNSNRSGARQLWTVDVQSGALTQITSQENGVSGGIWSSDGKRIAFHGDVKVDGTKANDDQVRIFDKLFARHWDEYRAGIRTHVFCLNVDEGGTPSDLTPGDADAHPISPTFAHGDELTFSPDDRALVCTVPSVQGQAWSTHFKLARLTLESGSSEVITVDNPAASTTPLYSPDGRYLAHLFQEVAGDEADEWGIVVRDAHTGKRLHEHRSAETSVADFCWWDNETLVFSKEREGAAELNEWRWREGDTRVLAAGESYSALHAQGNALVFLKSSFTRPQHVMRIEKGGTPQEIADPNASLLTDVKMQPAEPLHVDRGDVRVHGWVLRDPVSTEKSPLVMWVHGGPETAWTNTWSWRWNPQLWAAQGYVLALPNPRGSTSYGAEFRKGILQDWGGKCFEDLMAFLAEAERLPYVDSSRIAAAGASFGGYMMNWFAGHTRKFRTLVTHGCIFNLDSFALSTEELWFPESEFGGAIWENGGAHLAHSPHRHIAAFTTPMLITHGEKDYRAVWNEGWQLFTALQRKGVPSRMVSFVNEGHYIERPRNRRVFHEEIFAWLARYLCVGSEDQE